MTTTATSPIIRAPRGNTLRCKGWQQEAALRMSHEQPRSRSSRAAGGSRHLRRHREASRATGSAFTPSSAPLKRLADRRNAGNPIRQAGRGLPHERARAARPCGQHQPRRQMGDMGAFSRARRSPGLHDVRPVHRRHVGVHRNARHPAGHVPRPFAALAERHFGGTLKRQARSSPAAWAEWAAPSPCPSRMNGGVAPRHRC